MDKKRTFSAQNHEKLRSGTRVGIISERPKSLEIQGPLTCRTSLRKRFGNIFSLFKDKELTDFG